MQRRNIVALSIFALFYFSFGLYLTLFQEKVVYQPFPQVFENCTSFAEADKINYQGTRMYVELKADTPTVVLYHGNAGSACDRYLYADMFLRAGYGYVVVEYAGYSNDEQKPSHERLKQDVRHVVDYLKEQNLTSLVVAGESIGTGVAAYHASLAPPAKLLLISPFTDLQAVARNRFWFYPTSLLVDNAFDNRQALENYTGETVIIHGTADKIIPYKLGATLFASLSGNKSLKPIEGAGHNDILAYEETHRVLMEFLVGE